MPLLVATFRQTAPDVATCLPGEVSYLERSAPPSRLNRSEVMKRVLFAVIGGVSALLAGASTPALAGAGTAYELEHARANARAGGPISEYDAELLERWGNSTGGPDSRKQYRA
jgi:hypothetical protein